MRNSPTTRTPIVIPSSNALALDAIDSLRGFDLRRFSWAEVDWMRRESDASLLLRNISYVPQPARGIGSSCLPVLASGSPLRTSSQLMGTLRRLIRLLAAWFVGGLSSTCLLTGSCLVLCCLVLYIKDWRIIVFVFQHAVPKRKCLR